MNLKDKIYEDLNTAIENYGENEAVVHYSENMGTEKLKYRDVGKISDIIVENLKYLNRDSICFGLLMDHNVIIPSIILSLKRLRCTFCFLDAKIANDVTMKKLGIQYIIVYNTQCNNQLIKLFFSITIGNKVCEVYVYESQSSTYKNIDFVVHTSGTTNIQKTVKVEHECIASNIICLRNKLSITSNDVIYFGTSLTFDPAIIELYLGLTAGAILFIVSKTIRQNPIALYRILFENHLPVKTTVLQMCPSMFLRWKISDIENILQKSSLRVLLLGGETFPNVLQTLKKSMNLRIFNIYGITELSCWSILSEITDSSEVNLGNALDDTILEIKDENGKNVAEGEGELFVGSYKRICYLDNEESDTIKRPLMRKTGDRVIIKDNKIIYKGRLNDTIKRFGNRIDLTYIENFIYEHVALRNVCIWLESSQKLILFVLINEVNKAIASKILDKLRVKLLHLLPQESMPDHIELLASLPLTKHGKIDKRALSHEAHKVLKHTSMPNKYLVNIFSDLWHKYFGNNNLELVETKTFSELGGTSVLKIQFIEELREDFHGVLSPFVIDYIFTSSYEKVHQFLENLYGCGNKRTVPDEHNKQYKFSKQDSQLLSMQIEWTHDMHACVDSTPVVVQNRRLILVGSFSNVFSILNVDTGEEIAKVVFPNAIEGSCLISYGEDFAYIGCYDYNMYCIEIYTGRIMWLYGTGGCIKNKPSYISKNTIVFGSYDKFLHCIETKAGSSIWKVFVHAPVTADLLIVNKIIIAMTIKGTCISLNEYGAVLWQIELGCPAFGSPVQLKNELVVADVLGTLHCFNFNGQKLWDINVHGNIYSSILYHDQHLLFGTHDSTIYCFQYTNNMKPTLKHELSIDSPTSSAVKILDVGDKKYITAVCVTGYVYIIEMDGFSIVSRLKLNGDIFSTPVIFQNKIFIGCRDNNLICINVK